MRFYDWLLKTYLHKGQKQSYLAEAVFADPHFPQDGTYDEIRRYLVYDCEACSWCIALFEGCWEEYERTGN